MRNIILVLAATALTGCSGLPKGTADSLDAEEVVSSVKSSSGATFAIRKVFTGGATGDTLHDAWVCQIASGWRSLILTTGRVLSGERERLLFVAWDC